MDPGLGNSQVKDNKIDLLVQQYKQFTILEEESIDSGFARFNTINTSLKALDEGYSSKNCVRKFLRALHPKWRSKVTTIEESKDLSSLVLDELIGNLKVLEVVIEKDSEIYRGKKERVKSNALKAKKESSDDETSTSESDDKEYVMAVRNFKKFFRRKSKFVRQPREEKNSFRQRDEKKEKSDRKCFRCGDINHLIRDCPKPPRNKDQKAFIGGSWSDSENDAEDKTNDETCLLAQSSNKLTLNSSYYNDNASSLDNDSMQLEYDNLCEISLNIINKNKVLKTKRDLLEKEILELNEKIKKVERNKEIDITCKSCQELKLENARLKETQVKFLKFDKSANSLREMLNNKNSSSCKIGLGFDSTKVSTSETKPINFVGSSVRIAPDGSTINAHGSTIPGFVDPSSGEKATKHVFSPPMSSRSDFVITRKKLIHNKIEESKKPSLKSGLGYVCLRTCLEPDEWIKDSGCSKHMTGNKSLFSTYKAYDGGNVVFGSNLKGKIIGKGTISNDSLTISNVEHVDNLAFNLLSVGQICDNKCRVLFTEEGSEIIKDGKIIGNGIRKNGLYVMKLGNKSQDKLCLATVVDNSTLWHRRLGHANMRLIQSLSSKELVRNVPKLKYDKHFCDACKIGKQAHASHKAKNMVSTKRCLELLHMNLFGPSAIKSYGGSSIVAIRTDHGREFDNEVQFEAYCDAQGITHNFSPPRTPQSNRIVERKNRTLQEMSRTMLNEQSIPQKFWCNAVDTSTYILNRILIRSIIGKTPYEIFRVEESLNVTFDESPPPTKLSPLVNDDVGEEESIENNTKVVNKSNKEYESIEVDEVVNIKESKNHPLEQVIDGIFSNQSKYIKEMLKKFGLEDSKLTKTPMSTEIKLTKDDKADSADSSK
ncbi:zf-CCHC domain-containing protein [Tanacetum coccineum]